MADEDMSARARRLFQGPVSIVVKELPASVDFPEFPGMRFDGQRWVDAERSDRPFVPVHIEPPPASPDMFGGTGQLSHRRHYSNTRPPNPPKSRRRGPA